MTSADVLPVDTKMWACLLPMEVSRSPMRVEAD
jgi:hypothetical protein